MQGSDVAGRLKISRSAVSRALMRGEKIAVDLKFEVDRKLETHKNNSVPFFAHI
jgi:hypothetical protein